MNTRERIFCAAAALAIGFCVTGHAAFAAVGEDNPNAISPQDFLYLKEPDATKRQDVFREYEEREPCSRYMPPPEGYAYDGCDLLKISDARQPDAAYKVTENVHRTYNQPQQTGAQQDSSPRPLNPSVANYTLYFNFDDAGVRETEETVVQRIANEIKQHNPTDVTVTGHADAAGPEDYNRLLSQKRADAVVAELNKMGIPSRVIEEQARGEQDLAIQTADGTQLQANRRVTVDFRR